MCGCLHTVNDPKFHSDDDGMLTCPVHGERRYGWRSTGRDHSMDGWSAWRVERWQVFGEIYPDPTCEVHAPTSVNMRNPDDVANWLADENGYQPTKLHPRHAAAARERLDLWDRRGFEIRDAQVSY